MIVPGGTSLSVQLIGLDGVSYSWLARNLRALPTFYRLACDPKVKYGPLFCDGIPHTAPSWTTICTGKLPEEHGIFYFFDLNRGGAEPKNLYTLADIKAPLVWDVLEAHGFSTVALTMYVILPPVCHNCEFQEVFTPSEDGIYKELESKEAALLDLLSSSPDFLTVTIHGPDKANHLFERDDASKLAVYQRLDRMLGRILPLLDRYVILSDHGEPSPDYYVPQFGRPVPAHRKEGVIFTNMDCCPESTLGVTPAILSYFNLALPEQKLAITPNHGGGAGDQ